MNNPQLPDNKQLTPQNVFNIKAKIMRLLPRMRKNTDFQTFLILANTSQLGPNDLHADNINITPDEACKIASSLWREVMNDNNRSKRDTLVCFSDYMELLKRYIL